MIPRKPIFFVALLTLAGAGCDALPRLDLTPGTTADAATPPSPKDAPKEAPEKAEEPRKGTVTHGLRARVERVVDGDTIYLRLDDRTKVKLRVLGIDCPESRHNSKCASEGKRGGMDCEAQAPLGKKATAYAQKLLPPSKPVVLESPDEGELETDRYGRHLGYLRMADGGDFGEAMVAGTACMDFGWRYPHPRMERYLQAQKGRTDWAAKPD